NHGFVTIGEVICQGFRRLPAQVLFFSARSAIAGNRVLMPNYIWCGDRCLFGGASQPCDLQDWKRFQTSKLASYRLGVWGGPRRGNRRGIREWKGSDLLVSSINKMITQRVADQFCGGGDVRLFQDVGAMRTHGRHTQVQLLSDLG